MNRIMPLAKFLPLLAGIFLATQAASQSAPPEIPLSGHIGAAQAQQIGTALGDGNPMSSG